MQCEICNYRISYLLGKKLVFRGLFSFMYVLYVGQQKGLLVFSLFIIQKHFFQGFVEDLQYFSE